ncbi:hypothetical protein GCM10020229_38580 [Kitasatospora albolonga]
MDKAGPVSLLDSPVSWTFPGAGAGWVHGDSPTRVEPLYETRLRGASRHGPRAGADLLHGGDHPSENRELAYPTGGDIGRADHRYLTGTVRR